MFWETENPVGWVDDALSANLKGFLKLNDTYLANMHQPRGSRGPRTNGTTSAG